MELHQINYNKFKEEYKKYFNDFLSFEEFNYYFFSKSYFQNINIYEEDDFQETILNIIKNIVAGYKNSFFSIIKGNTEFYDSETLFKLLDKPVIEKEIQKLELMQLSFQEDFKNIIVNKKDLFKKIKTYLEETIKIIKYNDELFQDYKKEISKNKKKEFVLNSNLFD